MKTKPTKLETRRDALLATMASIRQASRSLHTLARWSCAEERAELIAKGDRVAKASIELDRIHEVVMGEYRDVLAVLGVPGYERET